MNTLDYFIKVPTVDVHLYAPFFEAFEGMLSLRTPNPSKTEFTTLHFMVSPDFRIEFEGVVERAGLITSQA